MKERKLTIKYDLINSLGKRKDTGKKPVYLRITFNRSNTKIKSTAFDDAIQEELVQIEKTDEAIREVERVRKSVALETNNFTELKTSFDGFKDKLKFYLTPIDEVYKDYGIRLISGLLLYGDPNMTAEEKSIINQLREFLPFDEYLLEKGKYYYKVKKNPHVFINMVFGFIHHTTIKPEFTTLNEICENVNYYLEGYYCLKDFLQSDYLKFKDEGVIINWLYGDLRVWFDEYIAEQTRTGKKFSDKSVDEINLGMLHSKTYLEAYLRLEGNKH